MVEVPHFDKRVWIGLIAIAVAAGLYLRHRSSSASATDPTVGDATGSLPTVDPTSDPYSSGDVTAIPGTQYGMPGPAGPPGPKGHRGKRGPRGKAPPKHKRHRHHNPAGSHAAPRIATQSHMANSTPMQSGVRVVQHRPGGVVQKGARKSNG
jgi:hypothetical protein